MKKLSILCVIIAVFAIALVAGCATQTGVQQQTQTQQNAGQPDYTPPSQQQTTPSAANAEVIIKGFAFVPDSLTIAKGTTVTWINQQSVGHTVTSDTGAFESATIASGGSFDFTFDTAGTYTYHCSIHPSMTGTIIVQ
jgi:plastocyanin